jgi:cytochrome b
MTPLTSRRRWPLLVIPMISCLALLMLVVFLFGVGGVEESFKRFANALLTSFSVVSALLAIAMFSYADSRERPLAPVFTMLAISLVGAILSFGTLSVGGDLLLESNGSAMAQILYNVVQLLVVTSALFIAGGLVLGTAFAIITRSVERTIFEEE